MLMRTSFQGDLMIETPKIVQTQDLSYAYIHLQIPRSEMHAVLRPTLTELFDAVKAQGLPIVPWFAHHLVLHDGDFDLEACIPVSGTFTPTARIQRDLWPAGTVARTTYQGDYPGLPTAWGRVLSMAPRERPPLRHPHLRALPRQPGHHQEPRRISHRTKLAPPLQGHRKRARMIAINVLTSNAAPVDISNIDTDQIIPKQFLKRIERTGYGEFLFYDWRRIQESTAAAHEDEQALLAKGLKPGDPAPTFVLNQPAYAGAKILIAGKNFGCGSSREHAAWALTDFGFLAVIAPSFADIFFSNAGKNGMILVRLSEEDVNLLTHRSLTNPAHQITISLDTQTVTDDQDFHAHFDIDPFRKYCLLNGFDDIGLTLRHQADLDTYEAQHDKEFWLTPRANKNPATSTTEPSLA